MRLAKKALALAVTSALLGGCVSGAHMARSDFEYLKEHSRAPLKIPAELDAPTRRADFKVPTVKKTEEMVLGEELVITSPAQVLALVDGSIQPQNGTRASIEFDITARSGDEPAQQIWSSIQSFLKAHNVQVASLDQAKGELITDWYQAYYEDDPSYFFGLEDYVFERRGDLKVRARYALQVKLSPSGRTAQLNASMLAFERYYDNTLDRDRPTAFERDNFTVNFLNGAVFQYQKDILAARAAKSIKARQQLTLSLQKDEKNNGSIVIASPFEQVWEPMELLLQQAGFELDDKDKLQATYFVDVPSRWLSGLFGYDDELAMASGSYKFLLSDRGETTSISIFDGDNKPLPYSEVEKAYDALKLALVKYASDEPAENGKTRKN